MNRKAIHLGSAQGRRAANSTKLSESARRSAQETLRSALNRVRPGTPPCLMHSWRLKSTIYASSDQHPMAPICVVLVCDYCGDETGFSRDEQ